MASTALKVLILLVLSSALSFGGVINVSSTSALNAANEDAVAGDTVLVASGTYTVSINPTNPGSSGSPIVYMAAPGATCSLYVGTPCINLTTDYVIVQGFRVKATNASNEMTVQSGDHTAIMYCYLYAYPSASASWDTWQITGDYCRFIGNVCNGLETSRDDDGERHEGVVVGGLAKYFIVEGNTVSRITHYGITVQGGGSAPGPSWGVVRNNVAFDCHVNLGQNYYNKNNLYEGNRTYSGGQMLSYRPGISYEGSANQSILRYNMFYGDSVDQNATGGRKSQMSEILTQSAGTIDYDNRLYGNALVGLSRNVAHQSIVLVQNDAEGNAMGKSVWVNNIIAYPNTTRGGFCYVYQDNSVGATKDTLRNNLFWAAAAGDTVTDIDYTRRTLAATEAAYPTLWSGNIEAVPLWTDSLSLRGSRNFALSASSPCVDAGAALTTVASNVSSSTLVTVGDALYFHYDWGMSPYDRGDSVLIGTNRCELDSVDYTNRRLILKSAITVTAGAGVHVLATYRTATASYTTRLSGSAPDIGPYERTSTSGGGTSLPGSTTQVAPDSNSSQMQPVTFRWRAVAGATKYWFSLSGDNWGSLLVNNAALTDTFITVSGITPGTWCVWNVATGNDAGWNTDAWSSWWTVEMGAVTTAGDTLIVDWNRVITDSTLTASTLVRMQNVQRVSTIVVLRNPNGYTVEWPTSIKWLGLSSAPQPTAGDTCAYEIVRGTSGQLYGRTFALDGASEGVSGTWVAQKLGAKPDTNTVPRVLNVKEYGVSGNGSTDDIATLRAAFAASDSGDVIHFPRGIYNISDTILVSRSGVTIEGEGAVIRQTTPGAKIFRVTGNRVLFRNITLIGDTNSSYTNNPDHNVGIDFAKGTHGHVVENCEFSILDIAIYCHRVDMMTVRNNYIHDVYQGVVGGYLSLADRLNGPSSYMIDGNRIHCAFGPLEYSRPIWLPYSDNFIVTGNELRGGGMAFEALTTSTAETTLFVKMFSGNTCDAAASGPSLVTDNVFDTHYAPAGRGPQSGYFQAVEVGFRGTVANNIIRNFNVAVGNTARLGRITGNIFEACGDSVSPGADGIIAVNPYTAKDTSGAVITGNTFIDSRMADIAVNWAASTDTVYDVIVSGNYSLNGRNEFLKATRTQGVLITGNVIRNANRRDSTNQAYAVRLGGGVKGYVDALSVTNGVAAPFGTVNAVAANTGVVIGNGRAMGLRGSQAYDISGGAKVIGRTETNGTVSAVTFENLAVHGTNPVISVEQSNGGGTPNIIIYDSTLAKYVQIKLDVTANRAYYGTASGVNHYWNVGSTNIAYWTETRLRSNVEHLFAGDILSLANFKILNKAADNYNTVMTRTTSGAEAFLNLDYIGKIATRTNTGTTTVDSIKVAGGNLVFYVGGTAYKAVP